MTAQLSRERLEDIKEFGCARIIKPISDEEILALVDMALAGMDSEPVAYFYPGDETEWQGVALAEELDDEQKARCIPLYASPPAPVAVPSGYRLQPISEYDAMCAAMLKAGPVTAATVPDGWKLVPVEPTAEMYDAGDMQLATKQVWDAMLAVAPAAPEQE